MSAAQIPLDHSPAGYGWRAQSYPDRIRLFTSPEDSDAALERALDVLLGHAPNLRRRWLVTVVGTDDHGWDEWLIERNPDRM